MSGRIQDGVKPFASKEELLKHGSKITLYTSTLFDDYSVREQLDLISFRFLLSATHNY